MEQYRKEQEALEESKSEELLVGGIGAVLLLIGVCGLLFTLPYIVNWIFKVAGFLSGS